MSHKGRYWQKYCCSRKPFETYLYTHFILILETDQKDFFCVYSFNLIELNQSVINHVQAISSSRLIIA